MNFEEISGERQLDFVRKFVISVKPELTGKEKLAASIQEDFAPSVWKAVWKNFHLKPLRSRKHAFLSQNLLKKNILSPVTANAAAHLLMVWKPPSSMRKTETISAFPMPPERLLW